MSRTISIGFGVFALLLIGLLVLPHFIDLNKWKPQLEASASQALGRQVHIDGEMSAFILPYPGVTLGSVRVANEAGAEKKEMLTVEEITTTVSLFPLLTKTLEFSQISLVKPDLVLDRDNQGHRNWGFLDKLIAGGDGKNVRFDGWEVSPILPRINVHHGSMTYKDGTSVYDVSDFQVALKSNSVAGPYALKGKMNLNDKEIQFETRVGELKTKEPISLDAQLSAEGQRLQVVGNYNLEQKSFKGQLASKVNPGEFMGDLSPIQGDATVTADITSTNNLIQVANLIIAHGDQKITGAIKLDLGAVALYEATFANLPGQTNITFSGPATKLTQLQGKVELASINFEDFEKWLNLGKQLPIHGKAVSFSSDYDFSQGAWKFSFLKLNVDDKSVTGSIQLNMPDITMNLSTPNLTPWLQLIDAYEPRANISLASLSGTVRLGREMDLNTRLSFMNGYVYGRGKLSVQDGTYDLNLEVSYPNLNDLLAGVGVELEAVHLGALKGQVHLVGDRKKTTFSELNASLSPSGPNVQFGGNGSVTYTGAKPVVKAELNIGRLSVDELLAHLQIDTRPRIMLAAAKRVPVKDNKPIAWSREPISLNMLNDFDGDIRVKADSLVLPGLTLDKLVLPIALKGGVAKAESVTGNAEGGSFEGSFTVTATKLAKIDTKIKIKDAKLEKLSARFDADLDVTSEGASLYDLVAHADGKVNFTVRDISIPGFDAEKFVERVNANTPSNSNPPKNKGLFGIVSGNPIKEAEGLAGGILGKVMQGGATVASGVGDVLQRGPATAGSLGDFSLLIGPETKGMTKFDSVTAKGALGQGVLTFEALNIKGPQLSGQGNGTVNLVEQTLNINTNLSFINLKGSPPIGVGLQGSMYQPKRVLQVGPFSKYLVGMTGRRILAGVVDSGTGLLNPGGLLSIIGE